MDRILASEPTRVKLLTVDDVWNMQPAREYEIPAGPVEDERHPTISYHGFELPQPDAALIEPDATGHEFTTGNGWWFRVRGIGCPKVWFVPPGEHPRAGQEVLIDQKALQAIPDDWRDELRECVEECEWREFGGLDHEKLMATVTYTAGLRTSGSPEDTAFAERIESELLTPKERTRAEAWQQIEAGEPFDLCTGEIVEASEDEADGDQDARPIGSLLPPTPDDGTELLRSRFLCRGGGALLVGQSGQGKSSLVVQMTLLWSIGRACFGFTPAQSLRTLIVQAENDDGDLHEMFCGICDGLQLSPEDRRRAGDSVLIFNEDCRSGDVFMAQLDTLATRYTPDLIVIDPALAYVNGDTKDAEAVGAFLRRGFNPILHRHNCGGIVVHHTTKQRADGPQATHDFLYSGAGSIEWTNWARAVLSLETKGNGCFALHAPKRGSRIGWKLPDGRPEFVRFIRHARSPGTICWQDVDAGEVEQVARTGKSKADLLAHVPTTEPIPQTVLLEKANAAGIGQKKARAFLDELIAAGTLHLWLVKRKGTNPEKRVSRHPQPL